MAGALGPAIGAALGNVAEGVGTFVAISGGIRRAADAERVQHEDEGTTHATLASRRRADKVLEGA
jgi:hypothetical protein